MDEVATGDRTETFRLPRDVAVKGGYAGFGEPSPDARDIDAYRSILSGDLLNNDVTPGNLEWQGLSDFVTDASLADNCYSVVTVEYGSAETILDGFFITCGHAEKSSGTTSRSRGSDTIYFSSPQADWDGAGAFVHGGNPRFIRCTFYRNSTRGSNLATNGGGAVAVYSSDAAFENCLFEENVAFGQGANSIGGSLLNCNSDSSLIDCTFVNNVAAGFDGQYAGGAIANTSGTPVITGCTFLTNRAIDGKGGAIYDASSPREWTLESCHFEGNAAAFGGAIHTAERSGVVAFDCVFLQNQATGAGRGGALDMGDGIRHSMRSCYFVGNSAGEAGGAVACSGIVELASSVFSGNSARNGGALYVDDNGRLSVFNCTLVANHASNDGGAAYQLTTRHEIRNCIVWDNVPDGLYLAEGAGAGVVSHSIVQGGYAGLGRADNLDLDPRFRDPVGPDGIAGTLDDDLRLTLGSPCLDAGDNAAARQSQLADLDGNPRIGGATVDIGAYEFHGPFSYYVDAAAGDDSHDGSSSRKAFATIQKGIASAQDGYTVVVLPGVYQEEVNFDGKAITVAGSNGGVILEAPGGYAVSFYTAERSTSVLKNFVIRSSDVGIFIAGSSPTIQNVTAVNNEFAIAAYAGAAPDISNCIFWDNLDGDLSGCTATFSCIEQGAEGQGNISQDPLFADPDNGDYHLLAERGRFVPAHGLWTFDVRTSPCVDAGNPLLGPGAEQRPNGGRINMGAFGGTLEASMSEWPLAGDINRDGIVDFYDLAVVMAEWLETLPTATGTMAADTAAPQPDPARWDIDGQPQEVHNGGDIFDYYVEMSAAEAADPSGPVEYYFECREPGGLSSGWQASRDYRVLVGRPGQRLQFRVQARDQNHNTTDWSEWIIAQ
jgi:predicted outer membrane repeat protein